MPDADSLSGKEKKHQHSVQVGSFFFPILETFAFGLVYELLPPVMPDVLPGRAPIGSHCLLTLAETI